MIKLSILSLILALVPAAAHAHGGGLNKEGCHNNRQTGDYHCHRGAKARPQAPAEPTLTGIPRIIDGDTIRIGNTRIRFHGIDAPEAKQTCTVGGKEWSCGQEATNALVRIVGERQVSCSQRDLDRYGRIVAVCRAGSVNLNAWMVGEGWAVAYRRFSMEYVRDETTAQREKRGIWRGNFMPPWEWRRQHRR
jgi:endonuclease YncB( thermonuclease family)